MIGGPSTRRNATALVEQEEGVEVPQHGAADAPAHHRSYSFILFSSQDNLRKPTGRRSFEDEILNLLL